MVISGYKEKLQRLDDSCYDTMKKGYRPGTKKNLRSQASIYSKFCTDHGLQEYPADEWQLVRYAGFTSTHVTSQGKVDNYVGGVRTLQKLAGYPTPPASSPNLKLMMKGLKTELSKPLKQSMPVTPQLIFDISRKVDFSNDFHLCSYAATLTGFYMCLRKSNLVPVSTPQFNPKEQLTRGKVAIDEDLEIAVVLIEWSKVMQHNERELWVSVLPAEDPMVCPIRVLHRMFAQIPATDNDPCFCYRNSKNVLKALTYEQLLKQLREWIGQTGRQEDSYSLHGLRRGGTSHCFNSGICSEYIKNPWFMVIRLLLQIHRY